MEEVSRMQSSQTGEFTKKYSLKILQKVQIKSAPLPTIQVLIQTVHRFTCSKKQTACQDAETIASALLGAFIENICG